ncbi:unnamed protein product [Protopolystoma xenopodis]|uniref:Uncharacterized protein n=1 Tax=Protopolystoma xenopodis TaxID=117903 RepID=A0A448XCL0_9PLAT|nr:unnamed protein product [Protopolystoma xenopodis]
MHTSCVGITRARQVLAFFRPLTCPFTRSHIPHQHACAFQGSVSHLRASSLDGTRRQKANLNITFCAYPGQNAVYPVADGRSGRLARPFWGNMVLFSRLSAMLFRQDLDNSRKSRLNGRKENDIWRLNGR